MRQAFNVEVPIPKYPKKFFKHLNVYIGPIDFANLRHPSRPELAIRTTSYCVCKCVSKAVA